MKTGEVDLKDSNSNTTDQVEGRNYDTASGKLRLGTELTKWMEIISN
jgi:hypothetical protein